MDLEKPEHVLFINCVYSHFHYTFKNDLFACFIDFKKAFDWINRQLLQCRMLNSGFIMTLSLYQEPVVCVQVNKYTNSNSTNSTF